MTYTYNRYATTFGLTDADAVTLSKGFALPRAGGPGASNQGAWASMRLYKYSFKIASQNLVGGAAVLSPALCWVTAAGAPIDLIQTDTTTMYWAAAEYSYASFDHDYGSDGIVVYRPQIDATDYYLGMVNRLAWSPPNTFVSFQIQYGVDVDYRKLITPVALAL